MQLPLLTLTMAIRTPGWFWNDQFWSRALGSHAWSSSGTPGAAEPPCGRRHSVVFSRRIVWNAPIALGATSGAAATADADADVCVSSGDSAMQPGMIARPA